MEVAALVGFLAPFLPYLTRLGEQAAEEAGKALGAESWTWAKTLWEKLRPRMEATPEAKGAVADAVTRPADERVLGNLELQVEKLLEHDDELRKELTRLWEEAARANVVTHETYQAIGARSVAVRTAYGSINTGDQTSTPTYSDEGRDDAERPCD